MQLHKTRVAGVSLSAAALALLTVEGPAAADEGTPSPDLRGRVTAVASDDFVLQKYDGSTETVDTTGGTTYAEPGSSTALLGVLNGENVAVPLDPSASSPTATNVVVFPNRVGGRVTSVSGSTLTLSNRKGDDTVLVSPSAKYYEKGTTPTGVSQGELVSAFGLPDSTTPGDLDAQVVAIFGPRPPQTRPQAPAPVTQSQPRPEAQPQPAGPTTEPDAQAHHPGPAPQHDGPQSGARGPRGGPATPRARPRRPTDPWVGTAGLAVLKDSAHSAGTTSDKGTPTNRAPTGPRASPPRPDPARGPVASGQPD